MKAIRWTLILPLSAIAVAAAGAFLAGETQRASDIETTMTRGDIVLSISAVGRFRPIAMVEIDRLKPGKPRACRWTPCPTGSSKAP